MDTQIKSLLVPGTKGTFQYKEYKHKGDENPVLVAEIEHKITVKALRTNDFIVQNEDKRKSMYCHLPKNSRNGMETYFCFDELVDGKKGFVKHVREVHGEGQDKTFYFMEMIYILE